MNGRLSSRSFPRYRLDQAVHAARPRRTSIGSACRATSRRGGSSRWAPTRAGSIVTGSLKFDSLEPSTPEPRPRPRAAVLPHRAGPPGHRRGSTMKGEEAAVLRAFRRIRATSPTALLVLAPRHPERFDEVTELCRSEGWKTLRRSRDLAIDAEPRGTSSSWTRLVSWRRCTSSVPSCSWAGAWSPPAATTCSSPPIYGKPIVFGPHMDNFREIADACVAAGAAVRLDDAAQLEPTLVELLGDPVRRASLGAAARALVEANRAPRTRRCSALEVVDAGSPSRPTLCPSDPLLEIIYSGVARWRRRGRNADPKRAGGSNGPVISVGNLSVGGTGKTPAVAAVARWLMDAGERRRSLAAATSGASVARRRRRLGRARGPGDPCSRRRRTVDAGARGAGRGGVRLGGLTSGRCAGRAAARRHRARAG